MTIVPEDYLLRTRDFTKFKGSQSNDHDDLLYMGVEDGGVLDWEIDNSTGEFRRMIGWSGTNGEYSMAVPAHPPGFMTSLSGGAEQECIDGKDVGAQHEPDIDDHASSEPTQPAPICDDVEEIDSLLPPMKMTFYPESFRTDTTAKPSRQQQHWARNVDIRSLPDDYAIVVPNPPAFVHPFDLDPFQQHAIYHLERGESVFVAAHTSAGKTAIAEYAIALSRNHLTRAIYTSPIKALSNQKFRDFRETFGKDAVGLLTGDVQINPDAADCLIMTTEILRSMLYRDADLVREVEWVIFDEVHYVNDAERGVVWEEVIIMLPRHVHVVLLSATTPNTFEFADWVGRTRSETVHVISTPHRPVPLEHLLYVGGGRGELFSVVSGRLPSWNDAGYRAAQAKWQSLRSKDGMVGGSQWVELVYCLRKKQLLPVVVFSFSRRRCEEYADALSGVDLIGNANDRAAIRSFFAAAIERLDSDDRALPQVQRMGDLLQRGIAVHHSGLLPIMKEAVEMLFARGLVRVLFATETFAMGVNMPARTVVFSALRKHDGSTVRLLQPGEYTQMAGRAGRRGKDQVGTVIVMAIADGELMSALTLKSVLLGTPTRLASQFRITYGMILSLLRFEALRVEEMLKRSFSENAAQKRRPEDEAAMKHIEAMLEECMIVDCPNCVDLDEALHVAARIKTLNGRLHGTLSTQNSRYLHPGRVFILYGNYPALLIRIRPLTALVPAEYERTDVPFPPSYQASFNKINLVVKEIAIDDIVFVTTSRLHVSTDQPSERQLNDLKRSFSELLFSNPRWSEDPIPEFKRLDLDEARIRRTNLMWHIPEINCPEFKQHFTAHFRRATLAARLAEMQLAASDSSLAMLPDYHARIAILKELQMIDPLSSSVQLKGRVACEIRTVDGSLLLLLIQLLFGGRLMSLKPAELAALLSAFYFQERMDETDEDLIEGLPEDLCDGCRYSVDCLEGILSLQRAHGVFSGNEQPLRTGLVRVVYFWALGHPFARIAHLTTVLEGTIVRCIVRLEEGLRELAHAARIMGEADLAQRFEAAAIMIKRDICFASSLYL